MTTAKKAAASRVNGRKSRGPRSGVGKARASRNARRHGLAAFASKHDPAMARQIKEMVDAICTADGDPLLREQAAMIAENQLWLSRVTAEKVAVIERLRDPKAFALTGRAVLARAKLRAGLFDMAVSHVATIDALIEKTVAAGRDPELEPLPPELETAWPPPWVKVMAAEAERDQHQALREAIGDLERLRRYEKRAWSRRNKAIRAFLAIKLTAP